MAVVTGEATSDGWTNRSCGFTGNTGSFPVTYDLQNLAKDTLAILDSNPAVLVRMETLRRATLYARQDTQAAKELLNSPAPSGN